VKVDDLSEISSFSGRVRALLKQPLPYADPAHHRDGLKPAVVKLSEDAASLWEQFYNHVEARVGTGREYDEVVGIANKAPEHATRLAATIAFFNTGEMTLGYERMSSGVVLAGYQETPVRGYAAAFLISTS